LSIFFTTWPKRRLFNYSPPDGIGRQAVPAGSFENGRDHIRRALDFLTKYPDISRQMADFMGAGNE
jgi:hypothetical protein